MVTRAKSMVQNEAGEEREVRTTATHSRPNKYGVYCKSKEKPSKYYEQWIDGMCISKKKSEETKLKRPAGKLLQVVWQETMVAWTV